MSNDKPARHLAFTVHNEELIQGFFGQYRFLSNFYPASVIYDGVEFPSVENAFQASRVRPPFRVGFQSCTPSEAKRVVGRFYNTPNSMHPAAQWDALKFDIMTELCFDKFSRPEMKRELLATGEKTLVDKNDWKDTYWGSDVVDGGSNNLGHIITNLRTFFRTNQPVT